MSAKTHKPASKPETKKQTLKGEFVFSKVNYQWMIAGFVLIVAGFALMYGGKEDIYSFRKITLAPIVVLTGFVVEVFAIMQKPKQKKDNEPS